MKLLQLSRSIACILSFEGSDKYLTGYSLGKFGWVLVTDDRDRLKFGDAGGNEVTIEFIGATAALLNQSIGVAR